MALAGLWLGVAVLAAAAAPVPQPPSNLVPLAVRSAPAASPLTGLPLLRDVTGPSSLRTKHRDIPQPAPAVPVRLSMPGLSIDAPVVPVSLNPDGSLEVPRAGRAVGWWKDSAPPAGTKGSTVIDGHRDTRRGAAVFAGLTGAVQGDLVRLVTTTGVIDYRVDSVTVRRGSELPADVLSADLPHRLVLVTCVGPFTPGSGYRDRLFVIARPAS